MKQLQKQVEAMHPLALALMSDEFSQAERRKFLEGVSFWMMFELSDALNKLCADDREKLRPIDPKKKATTKSTKSKPRRNMKAKPRRNTNL